MKNFKIKLINFYRSITYKIFEILYGSIDLVAEPKNLKDIDIRKIKIETTNYSIYICNKSRLYTDTIHDTAIIKDNQIVNGPSFQYRKNKNAECKFNSVLTKGTPRFKKKVEGKVLSLLTGGGGNSNYWHWLFDVLPRIHIAEKLGKDFSYDYYLFPSLDEKFQNQTLDLLNIPKHKRISSKQFRHLESDQLIVTDHPYNLLNDPMKDSLDIPNWISSYLKKKFLNQSDIDTKSKNNFPKKIYINRKDGKSHRFITNQNEVEKCLLDYEFTSLTLSDYTFKEQVQLFNNAEFIIGLHGAGFGNVIFCKPKTKVVEFNSFTAGDIIKNICKQNNLLYSNISSENKIFNWNNQYGDIKVDIHKLKSHLTFD